jgi:CspA family cold shock protein
MDINRRTGTVTKLFRDRGFGFLTSQGEDVFIHAYDLRNGGGLQWETLQEGERVTFTVEMMEKGPRARSVRAA